MDTELTKLQKVALAALQGLLASGHYTNPDEDESNSKVRWLDFGKDWKAEGYPKRYQCLVASDAFAIARDFLTEAEQWEK